VRDASQQWQQLMASSWLSVWWHRIYFKGSKKPSNPRLRCVDWWLLLGLAAFQVAASAPGPASELLRGVTRPMHSSFSGGAGGMPAINGGLKHDLEPPQHIELYSAMSG